MRRPTTSPWTIIGWCVVGGLLTALVLGVACVACGAGLVVAATSASGG